MNRLRKIGWREMALLLVPTLALVCWGFWNQSRGPFKLVIDEIKISTPAKAGLTTNEPNVRPVEVIVFIGHEGDAPVWWGRGMNPSHFRVHFTAAGEKDRHNENVGGSHGVSFDEARGEYSITHFGRIPDDPNFLNGATCHVSVELESQNVPFTKMARAKASLPVKMPR